VPGATLLVGTSIGTLRVYHVDEPNGVAPSYSEFQTLSPNFAATDELQVTATLTRTVDKFAKRIEQLAIIKEMGTLVVLAGTFVLSRDIHNGNNHVNARRLCRLPSRAAQPRSPGATPKDNGGHSIRNYKQHRERLQWCPHHHHPPRRGA